jgi:hypothetical protein
MAGELAIIAGLSEFGFRDLREAALAAGQALPYDWRLFLFGEQAAEPSAMGIRLHDQAKVYAQGLEALVEAKGEKGRTMECGSLKEDQKERLATCLFLDTLSSLIEAGTHRSVLSGRLLPFQREPGSAVLRFENARLEIGSMEVIDGSVGRMGFSGRVIGNPK